MKTYIETEFKETEIGKIPKDWEVKEIGSFSNFKYGLGESAEDKGDIPYLRITDINEDGSLNKKSLMYISNNKIKEECLLNMNDVLVARTGATFGKTLIFKEKFKATYGGFMIKFLFNREIIDNNYFFQFSRSNLYWEQANNLVNGGAQPQFNANTVSKVILPIPPIEEQKAIAKILSDLDEKIEINRKINENLEEIGKSLFKRWFVDFEFPDEKGLSYKSNDGEMVFNEELQKEIPLGWEAGIYSDIVDITTGKGKKKNEYLKNGLYSIIGANGEIGKSNDFLYNQKLVLTGRVGTLGEVYYYNSKIWISDNVLISIPKNENNIYFIYYLLKSFNLLNLNSGSTQPLITQTSLKNYMTILPNQNILNKFQEHIEPIFEKIQKNQKEIQALQVIRDTLLPKLMKGEIRIEVD